jgi:hypothetical protein
LVSLGTILTKESPHYPFSLLFLLCGSGLQYIAHHVDISAETLFVDWVGVSGNETENQGDIYIVTKSGGCNGGVGKIPVAVHKNLAAGGVVATTTTTTTKTRTTSTTPPFRMPEIVGDPPQQASNVTCDDDAFRTWVGADMRRDGRLIAMLRGAGNTPAVYFFPRLPDQSVAQALRDTSCEYISPTSMGLVDQNRHEAVAFVDSEGIRFADASECDGGVSCQVAVFMYELVYPNSKPNSIVEPATTTSAGWQTITNDDFEDGTWGNYMPGGPKVYVSSEYDVAGADTCGGYCSCGGTFSAKIFEDQGIVSSFFHHSNHECASFNFLRVSFTFKVRGYDHLDAFFMELSLDGGLNYIQVDTWALDVHRTIENAKCYTGKVLLTPEDFRLTSFGNQIRLRFLSRGNAENDIAYIDNIKFEGYSSLMTA